MIRPRLRRAAPTVALLLTGALLLWSRVPASNDRDWVPEQSRTARAAVLGDTLIVENVRNARWSEADETIDWETRSYDLRGVESLWYILTPFEKDWRGPAHAFLSFGFSDGRFLAISVEARKEVGETYSILKGMLKRFELMYVVADERDVIGLRVNRFGHDVFVYPVRATPDAARTLLVEMLQEATRLADHPVLYGSLRNNCTTRILDHVNRIAPDRIPYNWRILMPGYSDALAHERGLLETELALDSARAVFRVNDRVRWLDSDADFSWAIRQTSSAVAKPE